eukprot:Lithocolla_globosa_v1_NODE_5313_length_1262_cov_1066.448219.p3 type:complete len:193 gc:universal NODE_5313_length_1262_cov_1066.448219:383-961(+)
MTVLLTFPTTATRLSPSLRKTRPPRFGPELSKNTPCLPPMDVLLVGPRMVSPVLRVLTTVVLVPTMLLDVTLLRPTTKLACLLASRFAVPTPKSCWDNGNTKLVPVSALTKVTNSGCLASSSTKLPKNSTLLSLWTPSPSPETGTVLVATPTTPQRKCVPKVVSKLLKPLARLCAPSTWNTLRCTEKEMNVV